MNNKPVYWFPAKRFGWGWGLPTTWQGWAVLLGYFVLLTVVRLAFAPDKSFIAFLAGVLGLTIALVGICLFKGEPPRWRWGRDD